MKIKIFLKRRLHYVLSVLLVLVLMPFHAIGAAVAYEQPVEMGISSLPEVIAEWNFTSAGSQGIIPASSGVKQQVSTIQAIGGPTFEALVSTDNSIKYQGWNNGANTKYWLATLSTKDYENITLSSEQTSSGSGPRDFKVQMSTDKQSWTDVTGGGLTLITSSFNCTTCKLQDTPFQASNQNLLYIRWLVTSTQATNPSNPAVGAFGSSLLKGVIVKGTRIDVGTETPTNDVNRTPVENASGQTEDALVSIKFNKGISLNTGYNPTIIDNQGTALNGLTTAVTNDTLIINHPNFVNGMTYTVTVPKELVKGVDGVALTSNITWNFSIRNNATNEPIALAEWIFANGGTNGSFPATSGLNKSTSTFTNIGGVFEAYDSVNKAVSYQGWNGSGSKYWLAAVSTLGYENITLSSIQNSSGTGPRDFKVQTSTNNQTWQDVPNANLKMVISSFDCGGNTCKLLNVPIPNAANQNMLYIRWLVSSNVNTKGEVGSIGSFGSSRIKDIRVKGSLISGTNPGTPTIDEVVQPVNGAVNVPIGSPVTVKFNKPISLVQGYSAIIKDSSSIPLSNVTFEITNNNTLKMNHPNFASGKTYTVSVPKELIKGQDNLPLIRDVSWSFTVQSSTTTPVIPKLINMTFNGDPKTSVALAWYTDVMTDTVVQVVPASAVQGGVFPEVGATTYQGNSEKIETYVIKADRTTKKKTNYYAHKAIANNLTPGTAYKYRVGNGSSNSWSQIGSFTTDTLANQPYHFIAGSDSQASSRSGFEPWADTFKKAKLQIGDPKFIINAGDLVDNGDLEEQWQWMLGLAQNELTTVPIVPVLGGHEVEDYTGDETTPNNNFYNHFNLPKQVITGTDDGSVYSFEYGDALYIIFNSQYEGGLNSNGTVKWVDQQYLDQVKWMKNVVAKSDKKWKFVTFHKGPYGAGDNSGQYEDERVQFYKKHLVPAFDEMGIDMVFEAHDHMYMRSFQMYNDLVVPPSQITKDSEGNAINPKGTIYLMSNAFGNKFYTKYPGYNDYFAAKNLQPNKKMFTDVYVSDQVLKFTAYTAAVADEGSGNNGVKAYDNYGIRRTDVKPTVVTNASVVRNDTNAVISWSPPVGSTEPVRGFRIYEKNDKASKHWSEYIPVIAGRTQYSFTVNNVNSTTKYDFIIKAVGSRLNSDPVEVSTN
ncbi:Ig-like domain-containing protein [Paenibacillus sp. NRS-1760]|uniref:Ig-like domain-containing protein n=1 Tax=Paenibacillus sp. NRS-1760 TaxID=3233902 RepID=UPI003D2999AC